MRDDCSHVAVKKVNVDVTSLISMLYFKALCYKSKWKWQNFEKKKKTSHILHEQLTDMVFDFS